METKPKTEADVIKEAHDKLAPELATARARDIAKEIILRGSVAKLTPDQRAHYVLAICDAVGISPVPSPIDFIVTKDGRMIAYANRTFSDQLSKKYGVSVVKLEEKEVEGEYIVKTWIKDRAGRTDINIGATALVNRKGEPLDADLRANARMAAVTKSRRRAILAMYGLGFLDTTEVETIRDAIPVKFTEVKETVAAKPMERSKNNAVKLRKAKLESTPSVDLMSEKEE